MTGAIFGQSRSIRFGAGLNGLAAPLVLAALFLAGGLHWAEWQWQRDGIAAGQWWLLLSGHFAHATPAHGISNFAAVVIAALVAPVWLNRWPGLVIVLAMAAGVGLGIWWFNPDIAFYRGFSGVGHGWLMVAFAWSPYLSPWFRMLAIVVIQAKVVWEDSLVYQASQLNGYFADAEVLTDAHWYGVLLALPLVLAFFALRFYQDRGKAS